MPPRLRGSRFMLRPIEESQLDALMEILTSPGVREWWGPLEDLEDERSGLLNEGRAFVIEIDGAPAGWVGYDEADNPECRHASLDIFLAPAHQGGGVGSAAIRLAARWLFEQRGHHRLTIDPACANESAIRAYEAVGFRPVGVMRRYERGPDRRWHDNLLMDLLREELRDGSRD